MIDLSRSFFFSICFMLFILQGGYVAAGPENERVPVPSGAAGVVERQVSDDNKNKDISATKQVPLIEVDIPEERPKRHDDN